MLVYTLWYVRLFNYKCIWFDFKFNLNWYKILVSTYLNENEQKIQKVLEISVVIDTQNNMICCTSLIKSATIHSKETFSYL